MSHPPSHARRRAALAALLLSGCGGARPAPETPFALAIASTSGGAYVAGCAEGDRVAAARPYAVERWHLPADGAPALTARVPVGVPGVDPPVVSLTCDGERLVVGLAEGAVGLEGGAVAWRGAPPAGWPAAAPPPTSDGPHRFTATLPDGRVTALGDWGRGTLRGGEFVEWRPAAGGLAEATFDGEVVWAVGPGGLWRWRPGPGEPMAVPLPAGLAGQPLVDVFRDGPYLWVRTAEGQGWPFDVRGAVPVVAAEPGTLADPPAAPLRAPAGPFSIEASAGARRLRILEAEAQRLVGDVELPGPLHALLPLGDVLLVAAGDEVRALRFGDDGAAHVAGRLRLWSPTVRLFAVGDRILLVGPRYGFAVARRP